MNDKTTYKKFEPYILWGLNFLQAVAIAWLAGRGVRVQPVPVPVIPDFIQVGSMGWTNDPDAVADVQSRMAFKTFGDTPAGKALLANDNQTVLQSDAVKKALGHHIPARDQGNVGSCVSFGSASAIEYLQCLQIVEALHAGQPPPEYKDIAQEIIYGGSRVEIGKKQIRGDGSVTAWAGEFVKKYGIVGRGVYGSIDLSAYSVQRCRNYGRDGVPNELETIAKQSPVKHITMASNADDVAKAIRQNYTCAIGSIQGFGNTGPYTRDKDGFLKPSGKWGHCQAVIGVLEGNRRGFLILNSWGKNWVSGPTGGHDIPDGSYFVDWSVFDKMVKEGDCVIFGDVTGFPAKQIEWDIGAINHRRISDAYYDRRRVVIHNLEYCLSV